ncbi:unnamed protein product [Allacma fusca]|uniref:Uncharacterized protein n=1 Tax=Allacma fusca TaxID=39272 RepID=A0A8J2KTY7_9HEXA|nr:unnamed protein product [Allacma fusca]
MPMAWKGDFIPTLTLTIGEESSLMRTINAQVEHGVKIWSNHIQVAYVPAQSFLFQSLSSSLRLHKVADVHIWNPLKSIK